MADYTALIAALSNAVMPCRELDALVWLELGDDWTFDDVTTTTTDRLPIAPWKPVCGRTMYECIEAKQVGCADAWNVPHLTYDHGSVVTLFHKTLRDVHCNIAFRSAEGSAVISIRGVGPETYEGANMAIAMLIGLFRVLELKNNG